MTEISAEFEAPELAELAIKRIRESVRGVHSWNIMYNKTSDKAMKLRGGGIYTIIPTAVTTHNYLTAVIESCASEDIIAEPYRSRKTSVCISCEDDASGNVRSLLNAFGAIRIK